MRVLSNQIPSKTRGSSLSDIAPRCFRPEPIIGLTPGLSLARKKPLPVRKCPSSDTESLEHAKLFMHVTNLLPRLGIFSHKIRSKQSSKLVPKLCERFNLTVVVFSGELSTEMARSATCFSNSWRKLELVVSRKAYFCLYHVVTTRLTQDDVLQTLFGILVLRI